MPSWADIAAGKADKTGSTNANMATEPSSNRSTMGRKTLKLTMTRPAVTAETYQPHSTIQPSTRSLTNDRTKAVAKADTASNEPEEDTKAPVPIWKQSFIPFGMSWADATELDTMGYATASSEERRHKIEGTMRNVPLQSNTEPLAIISPGLGRAAMEHRLREPPRIPPTENKQELAIKETLDTPDEDIHCHAFNLPANLDDTRTGNRSSTSQAGGQVHSSPKSTDRESALQRSHLMPQGIRTYSEVLTGPARVLTLDEGNANKNTSPGLLALRGRLGLVKSTRQVFETTVTPTKVTEREKRRLASNRMVSMATEELTSSRAQDHDGVPRNVTRPSTISARVRGIVPAIPNIDFRSLLTERGIVHKSNLPESDAGSPPELAESVSTIQQDELTEVALNIALPTAEQRLLSLFVPLSKDETAGFGEVLGKQIHAIKVNVNGTDIAPDAPQPTTGGSSYRQVGAQLVDTVTTLAPITPAATVTSKNSTSEPSTGLTQKERKAAKKARHEAEKLAAAQRKASKLV